MNYELDFQLTGLVNIKKKESINLSKVDAIIHQIDAASHDSVLIKTENDTVGSRRCPRFTFDGHDEFDYVEFGFCIIKT